MLFLGLLDFTIWGLGVGRGFGGFEGVKVVFVQGFMIPSRKFFPVKDRVSAESKSTKQRLVSERIANTRRPPN